MIAEATVITVKAKVIAGGIALLALAVADAGAPSWSPEDLSFKAGAVLIIIGLVKVLLKQHAEHKAEMKDIRDKHESDMRTVVMANTESNKEVCRLAEEQANYFKTVTRDIVNEKLHLKPHPTGSVPTIP